MDSTERRIVVLENAIKVAQTRHNMGAELTADIVVDIAKKFDEFVFGAQQEEDARETIHKYASEAYRVASEALKRCNEIGSQLSASALSAINRSTSYSYGRSDGRTAPAIILVAGWVGTGDKQDLCVDGVSVGYVFRHGPNEFGAQFIGLPTLTPGHAGTTYLTQVMAKRYVENAFDAYLVKYPEEISVWLESRKQR